MVAQFVIPQSIALPALQGFYYYQILAVTPQQLHICKDTLARLLALRDITLLVIFAKVN